MRSVTTVPAAEMTNVEAAMKYQWQAGFTRYEESTMRAASSDRPASSGSTVPRRRFAL